MSVDVGTATAYLDINTSKYSAGLDSALQKQNSFQAQSKALGKGLDSVGKKATGAGKALTVGLTTSIVAAGTKIFQVGTEFDSKMSQVRSLLDASTDDTQRLRDEAIKLGASSVYSASEAAEGMSNLASAGFSVQEVMDAMPGMLNLAASSGTDLATASDIAASSLRGFGLQAKDAGHAADVFAKAAADTNAGVADMGEAMKYVAPVAHSFNISIEQTAAAIGIMSNAGIKGSQAGTALRGALSRLASPASDAAKMMEKIGFNAFDAQGKMLPLDQMIQKLQGSMKGMTQEQEADALVTIFGQESLSGMLALVQTGPQQLADLTKSFQNSQGAAQKYADIMNDNVKGALSGLEGAIETASITINDKFTKPVSGLIKQITEVVNKFNGMKESQQRTVLQMVAFAAATGPALIGLGKLSQGFGGIYTAASKVPGIFDKLSGESAKKLTSFGKSFQSAFSNIGNLGGVQKIDSLLKPLQGKLQVFTGNVLLNMSAFNSKIGGVIGGITSNLADKLPKGLTKSLGMIKTAVKGEVPKLAGIFGQIGTSTSQYLTKILGMATKMIGPAAIIGLVLVGLGVAQQKFGTQLDAMIQNITKKGPAMIQGFVQGLLSKLPDIINAGTTLLIALINALSANLGPIIEGAFKIISSLVNGLANNIPRLIPVVITLIQTIVTGIAENLPLIVNAGLNLLVSLAEGFANNADKMVDVVVKLIIEIATIIIQNLPKLIEAGIKIIVALIKGLAKATPQLVAALPRIIKAIWDGLTSVNWGQVGLEIINGIGDGVKAAAGGLWNTVKNVASGALNAVKGFFGIHSPSTKFRDEVGKQIPPGIAEGVLAAKNTVNDALMKMSNSVQMQPVFSTILKKARGTDDGSSVITTTTNNSSSQISSLMHVDKLVVNSDDDIKSLAIKLEYYREQVEKSKGGK